MDRGAEGVVVVITSGLLVLPGGAGGGGGLRIVPRHTQMDYSYNEK